MPLAMLNRPCSAITGQIAKFSATSNFYAGPGRAGPRLTAMTGADDARVFFTNSGTEANEAGFKITRTTGRTKIISTEGAFHGRSMGSLALTHNPKYREPFMPLLLGEVIRPIWGWRLWPQRPATSWQRSCWSRSRAKRIVVLSARYPQGLRQICDQHGALL